MLDAALLQARVCLLTTDVVQLKGPAGLVLPEGSIFAFTFLKAFIQLLKMGHVFFFFFFFYPSSLSFSCAVCFFLIWFWNSTNVHLFLSTCVSCLFSSSFSCFSLKTKQDTEKHGQDALPEV